MEAIRAKRSVLDVVSVTVVMLVLIVSSFFFYARVIRENYYGTVGEFFGNFQKAGEKTGSSLNLEGKVLVLESTATSKFYNRNTGEPLSIMWSNFLKQKYAGYEVVAQEDFMGKDLSAYGIIILPFAVCLSTKEIEKIKEFATDEKKGLILDGYTGARDENGKWRELSFLGEVVGGESFKDIKEVEAGELTANLALNGNSILCSNIPPGFRLEVNTYNKPIAANIVETRPGIDGYWDESPVIYQKRLTSAESGIVHGKYIAARFVWLGFTMGSVTGNLADQKAWQQLLDNIFDYVSGSPIVYKDRWYKGKRTVAVFAEDTEDKFENALNAVTLLKEKDIPATFFCVPELAAQYPKVFEKIWKDKNFEVGLHGIDVYQGQTPELQEKRLKSGKEILEKLSGKKLRGFRPPLAIYDKNTLEALLKLDYEYVAGDDIKQCSPELVMFQKPRGLSIGNTT
ncbi:MAG: polysaccharide deacetylase family protein, partial [Candidatus Firestonebacteria bacterium]